MKMIMTLAAASALALLVAGAPQPAQARNGGAIAAGVLGGLAVGAIVGSQAQRNYYSGPAYYEEPRRVYRECRTVRREYEDRYGNLRVRRVQVCD